LESWARSSTPYLLLALAAMVGVAARLSTTPRQLFVIFVTVSMVGAAAYVAYWSNARGILDTEVAGRLFPSGGSFFALYYYGIAHTTVQQNRRGWGLFLGIMLIGLVLTGSRSAIPHLLGLIAIPPLARRHQSVNLLATVARQALVLIGFLAILVTVIVTKALDVAALMYRFQLLVGMSNNGVQDVSADQRSDMNRVAWHVFLENPFLGLGPGANTSHYWTEIISAPIRIRGVLTTPEYLWDTPLGLLADFGLTGVIALSILTWAYLRFARTALHSATRRTAALALCGWMVTMLFVLPLATPFQDRSIFFGLMFLVALSIVDTKADTHDAREISLSGSSLNEAYPQVDRILLTNGGNKGVGQ